MIHNHLHGQELDSITHSIVEVSSRQTDSPPWLSRLWNFARRIMVVTDEPQVWQRRDRGGKTFYHVGCECEGKTLSLDRK